jgi:hypothetical protein
MQLDQQLKRGGGKFSLMSALVRRDAEGPVLFVFTCRHVASVIKRVYSRNKEQKNVLNHVDMSRCQQEQSNNWLAEGACSHVYS